MTAFSNYLENEILDHLRGNAYTAPTNLYLGLYTSDPQDDDSGTELPLDQTGYTRQAVTFIAPTTGFMDNSAQVQFTASGGGWGTITHAAVFDGTGAADNMLWHAALSASKTVNDTDTLTFASGAVTLSLD